MINKAFSKVFKNYKDTAKILKYRSKKRPAELA